ncbi:hypothetical protein PRZ48_011388 [Zasmidium cellare]|uniref:Uncharacterized protein n=1 Tax=Zasmidium cellare TaxID=395010 RepID=A0ABR0E674_ZASCE|nr:hypothetical protein PRZ48_011388 [Zasmidium cellare]
MLPSIATTLLFALLALALATSTPDPVQPSIRSSACVPATDHPVPAHGCIDVAWYLGGVAPWIDLYAFVFDNAADNKSVYLSYQVFYSGGVSKNGTLWNRKGKGERETLDRRFLITEDDRGVVGVDFEIGVEGEGQWVGKQGVTLPEALAGQRGDVLDVD